MFVIVGALVELHVAPLVIWYSTRGEQKFCTNREIGVIEKVWLVGWFVECSMRCVIHKLSHVNWQWAIVWQSGCVNGWTFGRALHIAPHLKMFVFSCCFLLKTRSNVLKCVGRYVPALVHFSQEMFRRGLWDYFRISEVLTESSFVDNLE